MEPRKSVTTAYILWFFLGGFGAHKFYLEKPGMGILYLFTFGLFGIGLLIDLFTMSSQVDEFNRNYAAKYGRQQPNYQAMSAMAQQPPQKKVSPGTPERQLLKVVDKYEFFSFREILMETELETEVAEATLEKLIQKGLIKKELNENGEEIYRG